ncbi:MAG: carbohydrate binding domain-containing protein, partial [Clostridia bacterium]|nr:carbohydrate binding domain-containing protein [Clostridia bacterium]
VEYMINGDFETGAVGGKWQANTNAAIVTSPTHGGSYAAKMDYDNGNTMLQGYIEGLSDAATYTFSFWYYVPAGETVQIQLMMQCANSWSAPLGEAGKYSVPVTTGNLQAYDTWLQFTKEVTLNPGDIGFQFQLYTAQAGDVYYIDDVSLSATVADPEPEPEPVTLNIDFDVATDKVNGVHYNSTNNRTYLEVETAQTLPIDGWGGYGGNATLLIDDQQVPAKAAGLGSANKFQIYTADGTGDFRSASTIVIPAGATFTAGIDSVVFPKEFKIVKKNGVWVKYEPQTLPSDHSAIGPNLPQDKTNLVSFGSFDAATGVSITGNGAVADGMLRMDITGSDDLANFQVAVAAGKTYRLSVYMWIIDSYNIRIDGEASAVKDAYQNYIYSDANEISGTSLKADTAGWVEMVYEFTATKTGTAAIYFVRNYWGGNATVYVDDLCIYDVNEQPVVIPTPTDHGGDTEIPGNAAFVNMQNMTFDLQTWHSKVGNTSIADGMAKILVSGSDDYLQLNTVSVKAGVEYTLAFYIWVTEASSDFSFNLYMATSPATPSGGWCDNVLSRGDVVTNTPGG